MRAISHFVGGEVYASGERQGDVFDPNNGGVQAQVRLGTAADLERAVAAAREALPGWASMSRNWRSIVSALSRSCSPASVSTCPSRVCSNNVWPSDCSSLRSRRPTVVASTPRVAAARAS